MDVCRSDYLAGRLRHTTYDEIGKLHRHVLTRFPPTVCI